MRCDLNWGGAGYPAYDGFLKQSDAEKAAQAQSAQESAYLQSMMKTQFKESQDLLNNVLLPQLQQMAKDPPGFGAKALAAMQSQLINTVGTQLSSQEKSIQNQFATQNLAGLGSGVQEAIQANLGAQGAGMEAGGLQNIAIQNAQLQSQQQQFAMGGLMNTSSLLGQAPGSAGLALQSNKQTFDQAHTLNQEGTLMQNILGGLAGAGLSFATGGLSNLTSGLSFLGNATGGGGGIAGEE